MIRGVAISPGVAVARAFRVDATLARHDPTILDAGAVSAEVARFERACAEAGAELDATIERVSSQLGQSEADIFRAHRQLLRDPSFIGKVTQLILNDKLEAPVALTLTYAEYAEVFNRINDVYLRERLADFRDVVQRIESHLAVAGKPNCPGHDEPVILIAEEILPSHSVMFDRMKVVGIVTEGGGATGHAAILARSMSLAAV
ncbi:MAG: phosphoenolpyruvate--protein phosphotransferase, partial [Gemmataceae bacterium]|nr:phosphoenolpyruvate--protein phosphotransferase [Gemmataceae bacterium]